MGLKNLTLKSRAINEKLPPSVPFIITYGSVGLFKLDLLRLTLSLEDIDITFHLKSIDQLLEFGTNYHRNFMNSINLEKLKENCMKDLMK